MSVTSVPSNTPFNTSQQSGGVGLEGAGQTSGTLTGGTVGEVGKYTVEGGYTHGAGGTVTPVASGGTTTFTPASQKTLLIAGGIAIVLMYLISHR